MKVRVFRGVASCQPVEKPGNLPHCISTRVREFRVEAEASTTLIFQAHRALSCFSNCTFSAIIRFKF